MINKHQPSRHLAAQALCAGDTVFALSSAAGRAGVAVIRISGPCAGDALAALTGKARPVPRRASLARLSDPQSAAPLDRGLVLWFPGPASASGEDLVELHLHGGPAVVASTLAALGRLPGCRLAEPGEFTRRAFDNGKLDLTEVEGLADLIAAETDAQRRQALRQMEGALSRLAADWRRRLIEVSARLEALIDFSEEDLPAGLAAEARAAIAVLAAEIAAHLDDRHAGERLRAGLRIAIVGAANAGKSSLLNALARRDVAIVSETAGTTRDVIEVQLDLGGYPVTLADSAGLRPLDPDTKDEDSRVGQQAIEAEGMRRARSLAAEADLVLALFDLTDWPRLDPETHVLLDGRAIVVLNKADLIDKSQSAAIIAQARAAFSDLPVLLLSVASGEGLGGLLDCLTERIAELCAGATAAPLVTRQRQRQALEACLEALERAGLAELPELTAEDVRAALRALGRLVGQVDVEEVLDNLFRDFCIGK